MKDSIILSEVSLNTKRHFMRSKISLWAMRPTIFSEGKSCWTRMSSTWSSQISGSSAVEILDKNVINFDQCVWFDLIWVGDGNKSGCCPVSDCTEQESLEHLLVVCPYYDQYRTRLRSLWTNTKNQYLKSLVSEVLLSTTNELVQFILDPSVHPVIISHVQAYGKELLNLVFHLTRTWCFTIHRERVKLLKLLK